MDIQIDSFLRVCLLILINEKNESRQEIWIIIYSFKSSFSGIYIHSEYFNFDYGDSNK